MISRIWHGYTLLKDTDAYENLLKTEIFIGIKNHKIPGYKGIQLLKRNIENVTEFITIMWFDSFDAVRMFAGEDYENAVVPEAARELLYRYDHKSQHYEVREEDMVE